MNSLKKKYWKHVAILVGCIYLTLPIAKPLSEFLRKRIPFRLSIDLLAILLVTAGIYILYKKIAIRKPSTGFLILALITVYTLLWTAIKIPEEKIHFLEYGLLAFFVFRAIRFDFSEWTSYSLALLLTSLFGWLDEGIQHLLPGRFYDLRDVGLNILGGLLGVLITWIVRREAKRKKVA